MEAAANSLQNLLLVSGVFDLTLSTIFQTFFKKDPQHLCTPGKGEEENAGKSTVQCCIAAVRVDKLH